MKATRLLVLLAAALALSGCGSLNLNPFDQPPYWVKVEDFTPTKIVVVDVERLYVPGLDGPCALTERDKASGECRITFSRHCAIDRQKIVAHEKRHCSGWDHPNHRLQLPDTGLLPLPQVLFR